MGLTNQWFCLSSGINQAIQNGSKVVVIDKFLCDYDPDEYILNLYDIIYINYS
jgi:hypothetical protein